jgi:tetrapyrrole methylase family protein/MazG family protein
MTSSITVIGLGSGDENQLTLGTYRRLKQAEHIYMRTDKHPVTDWLRTEGITFQSFDGLYEAHGSFEDVYEAIVAKLLQLASDNKTEIIYAVPGHPMVAERTTRMLRERCAAEGVQLTILGGESFLDEAFVRLGLDPIDGFTLIDAFDVGRLRLNSRMDTLIAQVYDQLTASEVKLSLMEQYPDSFEVVVGHGKAGAGSALRARPRKRLREFVAHLGSADRAGRRAEPFLRSAA